MPLIDRDGVPLFYEVMGQGAEPLLLIMGLGGDHRGWMMQVPALHQYKLILPDNRTTGKSGSGEGPFTIEDMARDHLAILEAEDIDKCHVMGISMGGMIAQTLTHLAPEKVATLTLVATYAAPAEYENTLVKTGLKNLTGLDEVVEETLSTHQVSIDEILTFTLPLLFTPKFLKEKRAMIQGMMEMMAAGRPEFGGFVRQLIATQSFDSRPWLGTITCPTHVIKPGMDQLVSPHHSDDLAKAIPGAQLSLLPEGPHACNVETVDAFNALAVGFLGTHPLG